MVNFGFNLITDGQQPNSFRLVILVVIVNFHFHSPHSNLATTLTNQQVSLLT
jgi:hypothetical protein